VITKRHQHSIQFVLGLLVTAAVGCAGNIPDTRQARAAGEWRFRLPTTQSAVGGLAYGRGGSSEPAVSAPDSQPLMASANASKTTVHVAHVRRTNAAPVAAPTPALTDPASTSQPNAAPIAASEPVQVAQADTNPEQRYGERETASKKLETFRGGDAIVIGAGTLVVVLLIVILVLLLR
jgi:hypothetical protein